MTKKNKILVIALYFGLLLIFLICLKFNVSCLIKKIFHIPCPACGMTRAFILILQFKIIESFSYNILAFPLFLLLGLAFILDIIDLILKKDYLSKMLKIIVKLFPLIIVLLLISWLVNIYRGI